MNLVLLEHKLYDANYSGKINCKTKNGWDQYFIGAGFKLIHHKYIAKNNPTNYYLALYKLEK